MYDQIKKWELDQLIKRTVLTATILATSLLAISPVWAQSTIKQENSSQTAAQVSDKVSSAKAKKSKKLSVEDLDKKSQETLQSVMKVMPDLNDYLIQKITKEIQNSNAGKIEVYEIELNGKPEGDAPNTSRVRIDVATGKLIVAEIQNGLTTGTPLGNSDAEKKADEYLQKLLNNEAKNYQFTSVYSYKLGENQDKPVTLVTYKSKSDEVYISLDSNGELKRFLKDIYPAEEE